MERRGAGTRLSGKEYVSGTISNERDISSWAADAAKRTVGWEIIGLTEKGKFDGKKLITRDEFTAYVARTFGLMTTGRELSFSDVSMSNRYRSEILAAYENGIIGGVGDNKFAPGALLTREQASTISTGLARRALGRHGEKSRRREHDVQGCRQGVRLCKAGGSGYGKRRHTRRYGRRLLPAGRKHDGRTNCGGFGQNNPDFHSLIIKRSAAKFFMTCALKPCSLKKQGFSAFLSVSTVVPPVSSSAPGADRKKLFTPAEPPVRI